jgi:hypothetical protein
MSQGGRLTGTGMPPDKKVNKAEELTYLSTNIGTNPLCVASTKVAKASK